MAEPTKQAAPTGEAALIAIALGEAEGINPISVGDMEKKLNHMGESFPPDHAMLITINTLTAITVLLLLVRWWVCWRYKRFMLEDWLMIPAGFFFCALAADTSYGILKTGLGKHVWQISYREARLILPVIYSFMPVYILSTFFAQLSVIALNFRITRRAIFPTLWWIIRLTLWHWIIWLPSTMVAFLVQCLPLESNYRLSLRFDPATKCKNYIPVYTVVAFVHVLADFAILTVPVYLVLKARVPRHKKHLALAFLAIGFIAALFSIVRATFAVLYSQSSDMTFIASWIAYCSQFELSLAMISTSLPKLRPLFPSIKESRIFAAPGDSRSNQELDIVCHHQHSDSGPRPNMSCSSQINIVSGKAC